MPASSRLLTRFDLFPFSFFASLLFPFHIYIFSRLPVLESKATGGKHATKFAKQSHRNMLCVSHQHHSCFHSLVQLRACVCRAMFSQPIGCLVEMYCAVYYWDRKRASALLQDNITYSDRNHMHTVHTHTLFNERLIKHICL